MTELTPDVLKRIADILSSDKAQTKRATHVSDSLSTSTLISTTYGYIVSFNGFETFVGSNEVEADASIAESYALSNKLQAWYLNPRDTTSGPTTLSVSHDDYCDWLRRKDE